MKIPVFVSCPSILNDAQEISRRIILDELDRLELEPRAIGRSDYPTELPLREVYLLAKHCSGGVILGFEQFQATAGIWKHNTNEEKTINSTVKFPTSWNHLEAGVLFSLGLPLLVFKEEGISGGVFDHGVTDVYVHKMPESTISKTGKKALTAVFLKWQAFIREHYYR
jgi:hypothetical protein